MPYSPAYLKGRRVTLGALTPKPPDVPPTPPAGPKGTLAYYMGAPPKRYAPLYRRPRPLSWEGPAQLSGSGVLVVEGRNFDNRNSGQPALVVNCAGCSLVLIRGINLTGWSPSCLLRIENLPKSATLVVENCGFYGYQTPAGKSGYPGKCLDIMSTCKGTITIRNNYGETIIGFLVDRYTDRDNLLTLQGNYLWNVQKLDQNGNTDQLRANGYQLLQCGEIKADIRFNLIENTVGLCTQQDGINIHGTSGQLARRLRVQYNLQLGLYLHPTATNKTGSSITLDNDTQSDATGVNDPHYVDITDNYAVGSTFGGFNGAGGYLNRFERNVNVNTGLLPDGVSPNGLHIEGINVWNYLSRDLAYFRDNTCAANLLGVRNPSGFRADQGFGVDPAQQLHFPDSFITRAAELAMYDFWRFDAEEAGIPVGLLS
ncbi:hypothetical protein [Hymenobacter tenuis]